LYPRLSQMAAHRTDVSNLNRIVICELILNGQIYGLDIRSLKFELTAHTDSIPALN
jgi:hypothetical protein